MSRIDFKFRIFEHEKSFIISCPVLPCRLISSYVSRIVKKPDFCICENKDADQLRGNREADQHLCFHYIDTRGD